MEKERLKRRLGLGVGATVFHDNSLSVNPGLGFGRGALGIPHLKIARGRGPAARLLGEDVRQQGQKGIKVFVNTDDSNQSPSTSELSASRSDADWCEIPRT